MNKFSFLLPLLATLIIVQSACVSVSFKSNSAPLTSEQQLGKTLLIGETTILNQSLIEELCQRLSNRFRTEGIDNHYHVFPPSELEIAIQDQGEELEKLINELQPTQIIRLKKAEGTTERAPSAIFSNKYPDYVFNTVLELNIYDNYPNNLQHKSLIKLDSWGGVRVELATKSKKIAEKIYNHLKQDAR